MEANSIPSTNFTPLMIFGNFLCLQDGANSFGRPRPSTSLKTMARAEIAEFAELWQRQILETEIAPARQIALEWWILPREVRGPADHLVRRSPPLLLKIVTMSGFMHYHSLNTSPCASAMFSFLQSAACWQISAYGANPQFATFFCRGRLSRMSLLTLRKVGRVKLTLTSRPPRRRERRHLGRAGHRGSPLVVEEEAGRSHAWRSSRPT